MRKWSASTWEPQADAGRMGVQNCESTRPIICTREATASFIDCVQQEKAKETWAREQEADGKRLRRERRALEAQAKELLQLPTRKERSQVPLVAGHLSS